MKNTKYKISKLINNFFLIISLDDGDRFNILVKTEDAEKFAESYFSSIVSNLSELCEFYLFCTEKPLLHFFSGDQSSKIFDHQEFISRIEHDEQLMKYLIFNASIFSNIYEYLEEENV
jgi:hypothetical protein